MSSTSQNPEIHDFDFVVVGGGLAGLCAAVAAARRGAKTAVIQDRPVFGGNSSSEIRVAPLGSASFNAWTRETGILEEFLLEERSRCHDGVYDGMASSHYDIVLLEKAKAEPNLSIFMNTSVRSVEIEPLGGPAPAHSCPALPLVDGSPRRITAVRGCQLMSEKELLFRATQFADCTGDATVGFLAGADFRYGREARSAYAEPMAPLSSDSQTMGSTLTMRARDVGRPVDFSPPPWAYDYRSYDELRNRRPARFNRRDYAGWWWIEIGSPFHQIDDNQDIRDELLRHVLGVWSFIKNHSDEKTAARNYALEWVGMVPGKRESRRLLGDVVVNENHCHSDPSWPDRVCYSGWFIDLHTMGGILKKDEPGEPAWVDANYRYWARIAPVSLPLRAFYSRNVENLWMAGRCISVSHVALGTTRVMMTHSLQGQAVGTAAAYAVSHSLTPRQTADPDSPHIRAVQQQLLLDDCNCWGLKNQDPSDLALSASASASSEALLDFGDPDLDSFRPLDVPRAQAFPVTSSRIDSVEFYVRNASASAVSLPAELHETDLIWDRSPGRTLAQTRISVPASFQGWVAARFDVDVTPGRVLRAALMAAPEISLATASLYPPGTAAVMLHRSPGGCEPGNEIFDTLRPDQTDIPPYEHWSQERSSPLAVRISPVQAPYPASAVNNGFAWPYGMPNLWLSDPAAAFPQYVELDFGSPRRFSRVFVSFDTDLKLTYHQMPAFFRARGCARNWKLHVRTASGWKEVFSEQGNFHRRRRASFDPLSASALRLEILSVNGHGAHVSAGVYEIRVL
ncbi:MAG: FAD-dependent oxidoreductase [Planctomycetes bacterium]|nr:FAD-dependent oxidoreductase [Planctomycetota bacterium]